MKKKKVFLREKHERLKNYQQLFVGILQLKCNVTQIFERYNTFLTYDNFPDYRADRGNYFLILIGAISQNLNPQCYTRNGEKSMRYEKSKSLINTLATFAREIYLNLFQKNTGWNKI